MKEYIEKKLRDFPAVISTKRRLFERSSILHYTQVLTTVWSQKAHITQRKKPLCGKGEN